ncbi:chalcone isomerase family protein [Tepidimonas sp.]|uniref:chalcone isomerase family protein n=1 Tax=Tepidimonas sp. TaxID=2002775 RepID=UPI002FE016C0
MAAGTDAIAREPVPPAQVAQPRADVPTAVAALLPRAQLIGQGLLRYWGWSVYYARLYAVPPWNPAALGHQPVVLELEYLRDFRGADIVRRSLQEMRRAEPVDEPTQAQWTARLDGLFPDVRAGDRIAGVWLPGQGARFQLTRADGSTRPLGGFDDAALAERFFGIWLAPTTSAPGLRAALLGIPSGGAP